MSDPIRIGHVGLGVWGPNIARNLADLPGAELAYVCDADGGRLDRVASRFPSATLTSRFDDLLGDPSLDAITIATPVPTHHELGLRALEAGKHVLLEKPLTATADQGRRLIDEAARRGLQLMVDHTFAYTGAVQAIINPIFVY